MGINELTEKYTYRIEWSEEDNVHISRCLEFPSLSAHGDTAEKAFEEIKFLVAESIKLLKEDNKDMPEPFSFKEEKKDTVIKTFEELEKMENE